MTCRECGTPIRPQRSPDNGRPTHHARGLCRRCYSVARRDGTLDQWALVQNGIHGADLVEDVEWLRETRAHPEWWAPRLGMIHEALAQRLWRAHRPDLARPVQQVIHRGRKVA